jgi:hypothetical protein
VLTGLALAGAIFTDEASEATRQHPFSQPQEEEKPSTMQNDKFDKKNDNIRPSLSPCFLDIINIRNVMEAAPMKSGPSPNGSAKRVY